MQKIMVVRKNNGVTLVALIITIVVLFIILSVTINYGMLKLHDISNKKLESELIIIQEAIMQRYALVKSSNQLGKHPSVGRSSNISLDSDTERPTDFVGTRLAKSEEIANHGFTSVTPEKVYTINAIMPFEEYYYLLTQADLELLGVEKEVESIKEESFSDDERSYIVNYFTGEVFDIINKQYYKADSSEDAPIYKKPAGVNVDVKKYVFDDN